jgi:exopolysaccharide biosynthesis polyprenyl glycosylphosphotransferase
VQRYREVILTSALDYLLLLASWLVFHSFFSAYLDPRLAEYGLTVISAGVLFSGYWLGVFVLSGLYKGLYLISRLDEFTRVVKAVVLGGLVLYVIWDHWLFIEGGTHHGLIFSYWGIVLGATIINRFVIRTIQRLYAQRGRGLHRTLIVGTGSNAKIAFDDLMRNKILGMEVIGYIQVNGKGPNAESGIYPEDVIGQLSDIDRIIAEYKVQDVLVAVEANGREDLVAIISKLDNPDVRLKLLPDFYQIVSGLSKTNQIFGMPIIEISPEPMPLWEKAVKRLMDVTISVVVLIGLAPFLLLVALFIRLGSPGPVIFRQERIGRNCKPFVMNKFRTMVQDAERKTGPRGKKKNDPRITKVGYWLRKLRIDELPQLYNVIRGQMSLVGPRPERQHFVEQFKDQIPLYMRRLRVRPGITGWAQVKWKYDASFDDVKEKTKYDLYYVENISLRMDIKIIINTLITMIKGKGQ